MIRLAAVGDLHVGDAGSEPRFAGLTDDADLLLLAGDLTRCGQVHEARLLARVLGELTVPVVAVLGNHDLHAGQVDEVVACLTDAGAVVLDGSSVEVDIGGLRVGVAGVKGFGGGMAGTSATAFGEPEMKAFVHHGQQVAERFGAALGGLDTHVRIGLTHYAPVAGTLAGEPPEIHPFLGDYRLAEHADRTGADLLVHGHAHSGRERGVTPGGIPVRNVARPVIRSDYRVYTLQAGTGGRDRRSRPPASAQRW